MNKKPAFIEIENFLIKRSLVQSVEIRQDYDYKKFLTITYYNGQEIKTYSTKTDSDDNIKKMFERIKENLQ